MSIEKVRTFLAGYGMEDKIQEFPVSSATVDLAAAALHTKPERIAKSMSFYGPDGDCILIVTAGDTKINNGKYKAKFGIKARMMSPEDALAKTGHAVGGVCPFALPAGVSVYLDESLKRFTTVFPACGSPNSAIEIDCETLFRLSGAKEWVDVCAIREEKQE